jgi:hypothetical protein
MRYVIMATFMMNGYPGQMILATTLSKEVAVGAVEKINSQNGLTGFYFEVGPDITEPSEILEGLTQKFLLMKR